jgi:CRP-like cAMP-binding protein
MLDAGFLRGLIPLNTADEAVLERLAPQLTVEELPKGSVLCEEGAADNDAIYLLQGGIELTSRTSTLRRTLLGGTPEAAHPIVPGLPRQFTARATTPVRVLRIDNRKLERLVVFEQITTLVTTLEHAPARTSGADTPDVAMLADNPAFRDLPRRRLVQLIETLKPQTVKGGEVILRQGQPNELYFVVREGRFTLSRKGEDGKVRILGDIGRGGTFGEESLLSGEASDTTVVAIGPGALWRLSRSQFEELLQS